MAVRFRQEKVKSNRHFTEWIKPDMKGYLMACCDCGLVHVLKFTAVKVLKKYKNGMYHVEHLDTGQYHVLMKVKRHVCLTAQQRKKKKKA